jgi:hypothetical protein
MKIKCIKAECPICKTTGSIQLFMNNNLEVRYARTRHYSHQDKVSKKPQFTYCRIENLLSLKTLLPQQSTSLNTEKTTAGQVGQVIRFETIDPQLRGCATIQQNRVWTSSSVRIEHQPPKLGVEGSNPSSPATVPDLEPDSKLFTEFSVENFVNKCFK